MKWLLLPLVFISGLSAAEPEPWGIKHWLIGATPDEARINGRDLACVQRWEEDLLCSERENIFGNPVDHFPETVAKYPAKVVEAQFWNDELIRATLQVKADEYVVAERVIARLLSDKFGQSELVDGESVEYHWASDNQDYVLFRQTSQADRFEIQIGSPTLQSQENAAWIDYTIKKIGREQDREINSRSGDI